MAKLVRRVIDLGFAVAILDLEEEPVLTIMLPETDADEARSISLWGSEGLRALASGLHDGLDEFDNRSND